VRFVEFYRPTAGGNWVYDIFNITLPDGYDETADLVTTLQGKFTNSSGNEITRESDGTTTFTHAGQSDTATTVTITHSTSSYKNTLVFDSGSQHKVIALLVEDLPPSYYVCLYVLGVSSSRENKQPLSPPLFSLNMIRCFIVGRSEAGHPVFRW